MDDLMDEWEALFHSGLAFVFPWLRVGGRRRPP